MVTLPSEVREQLRAAARAESLAKRSIVTSLISSATAVTVAFIVYVLGPRQLQEVQSQQQLQVQQSILLAAQADEAIRGVKQSQQQVAQLQASTPGTLEEGQKLCISIADTGGRNSKDGVIVPKSWTINLCRDYMLKTKGAKFQLGCVYSHGLTLGEENGSTPSPNCGWD
jgi:hypothetical protein